jgi:Spy/CpxP family protein refolding chaperone
MKSSWRVCLVVLGLALALPVLSNAQGPVEMSGGWGQGRGHGPCMGGPMFGMMHHERMKEALGLTDEQSEKLRQIFSESKKSSIRARAELQVKRMELHEIMMGEKTDREAALKKAAEISDLRGQMMRQHVETMLAAKAVLTPEQQKKAHALMAERWSHRGEGFEGHRGMGRGPGGPGGPGGAPGGPPHEFPPEPNED